MYPDEKDVNAYHDIGLVYLHINVYRPLTPHTILFEIVT